MPHAAMPRSPARLLEQHDESQSVWPWLFSVLEKSASCRHHLDFFRPGIEFAKRQLALQAVTFLAVANFLLQRGQKIEGNVRGLKVGGVGMSNVMNQRSERGSARRRHGALAAGEGGGVHARH